MKRIFAALCIALATPAGRCAEATRNTVSNGLTLVLRLHDTRVKRGNPIWFSIQLTNTGRSPRIVVDRMFHRNVDLGEVLEENIRMGKGAFVTISDASGQPVHLDFPAPPLHGCPDYDWPKDMNQLVIKGKRRPPEVEPYHGRLPPGKSVQTPSWVYMGDCPSLRPNPPTPPAGFAELVGATLKSGRYTIRAVYDDDYDDQKKPDGGRIHHLETEGAVFEVVP